MTGKRLLHYEIADKLGEGGMGVVYRARDTRLDRSVALKFLPPRTLEDADGKARFYREARTAAGLDHPNVCTVYEVGEEEGQPFLAMALIVGRTVKEKIAERPLQLEEALNIAIQAGEGLKAAHDKGVIHRDVKSANLMVTAQGQVKVMDFGLARQATASTLTKTGTTLGTVSYMSPEVAKGRPADRRSDIWSLGVVVYEMLAGRLPFQADNDQAVLYSVISETQEPITSLRVGVPAGVDHVVGKALAKEPEDRYQHIDEMLVDLRALRQGLPVRFEAPKPSRLHRRELLLAGGGAAALAALAAALDVGGIRRRMSRLLGGRVSLQSIAVLPLENLSGDPEQEYFVDGMTDALITDLSKISSLRVISRTTVMRYKKGNRKPLPEIARELGVNSVLEGSVVREGGRVRVTAQLIEASTDRHIWAESYERELSSVLALQAEIARAVAGGVRVQLQPREEAQLASARQVNPATYEAYLKGMFYLDKSTTADTKKGMDFLRQAVEKDPADSLANAGLAMGYLSVAHGPEVRKESLQRLKAAALTALELDDRSPHALFAMGMAEGYFNWNWDEAFDYMRRALEAKPNLAIAYVHRAWYHVVFGRMKEAMEDHARAREVDPLNSFAATWFAELYRYERRYGEATAEVMRAIELAPKSALAHWVFGNIYQDQRRYEEAIAEVGKAAESGPGFRWALGVTFVAAGRSAEARKILAELNQQAPDPWTAYWRAVLHAALGENDEAFRWLDYAPHHMWAPWVRVLPSPGGTALRKDARLPAMLQKWNLPSLGASPKFSPGRRTASMPLARL